MNVLIGAGLGFGFYALTSYANDKPITWQGSLYSAGAGALTGGVGGHL